MIVAVAAAAVAVTVAAATSVVVRCDLPLVLVLVVVIVVRPALVKYYKSQMNNLCCQSKSLIFADLSFLGGSVLL